jgi:hypothetical protein
MAQQQVPEHVHLDILVLVVLLVATVFGQLQRMRVLWTEFAELPMVPHSVRLQLQIIVHRELLHTLVIGAGLVPV